MTSNYAGRCRVWIVSVLISSFVFCGSWSDTAAAESRDWRAEFDQVSEPASGAMELTIEQLEGLLSRCATLKVQLEGLDESGRKVYGKRLQMTCDLYRFMLDSKRAAKAGSSSP